MQFPKFRIKYFKVISFTCTRYDEFYTVHGRRYDIWNKGLWIIYIYIIYIHASMNEYAADILSYIAMYTFKVKVYILLLRNS